jgi:hypothetical protein
LGDGFLPFEMRIAASIRFGALLGALFFDLI